MRRMKNFQVCHNWVRVMTNNPTYFIELYNTLRTIFSGNRYGAFSWWWLATTLSLMKRKLCYSISLQLQVWFLERIVILSCSSNTVGTLISLEFDTSSSRQATKVLIH